MVSLIVATYFIVGLSYVIAFQAMAKGSILERAMRQMGRCPDCSPLTDVERRNIRLGAVLGLAILCVVWPIHAYTYVRNGGNVA